MKKRDDIEELMLQQITELCSDLVFDKGLMELYEALFYNLLDLTDDQQFLLEQEIASFKRKGISLLKEQ